LTLAELQDIGRQVGMTAEAVTVGLPDMGGRLRDLAPMGLMGAATLGVGIARLRGWARTRLQQMDAIADWVRKQAP
jgi:p-aminobenzoyl-glutamate transporter AbgT